MSRRHFEPTKEQQYVIDVNDGSFLVIAPPGSGKTTVLTERVARLVGKDTELFRVLALTFTNKASINMKSRLFDVVGEHSERVTCCTFHAFCRSVLSSYGDDVGFVANTSIYENGSDQLGALHRGLLDDGILHEADEPDGKLLRKLWIEIGKLKRRLVPPEEVPKATVLDGIPLGVAYAAYDRTLRLYNAYDFDDLIFGTYRLLASAPRIAAHYRRMYKYVVIDEAQDTNAAQYGVLQMLCGDAHRNVMLVADADQSIFQFQGATTDNLLRFEQDFSAKRVAMSQNFRCAQTIVEVANRLIEKNPKRITAGEVMTAGVLAKGDVTATSYPNEAAEARAVCALVSRLFKSGLEAEWVYADESRSLDPEDVCILGRTRYALDGVLSELAANNIPYQFSTGRKRLFETAHFRGLDAAFRHILNPKDQLARRALFEIIRERARKLGIDEKSLGADLLRSVISHATYPASAILAPMARLLVDPSALDAAIDGIVEAARGASVEDERERALIGTDAGALSRWWEQFSRRTPKAEWTIGGFLADLALLNRSGLDGPGVRVLTIHAAKGLEFRATILVGMNEDTFPDYRSVGSAEELAEERRNAYVALTRAERMVHLTRPRSRVMPWGDSRIQRPSRFLQEAGIVMRDIDDTGRRTSG
ncbi:MAG: ATP-dependent helicase [Polyangiaceae bacterium]